MSRYLISMCTIALLIPAFAFASPVLRTGESVVVNADQVVAEDFYAGGGAITISGTIGGDLYAVGGSVTVNGDVVEDAVIVGGNVDVHGPVGDDVRLVGGELVVADTVGGDVVVFGGVLRVLSTATIEGDLLFFGGEADIAGTIEGAVSGTAERVRIDGTVNNDVTITTARPLELGDQANIAGDVVHSGSGLLRAPGSVVTGDITARDAAETADGNDGVRVLPLFVLFFTSLAYLFIFKDRLPSFMHVATARYGVQTLVGFGTVVLMPLAAMLLVVSVIGLPIGLALIFGYLALLLVGWSLGGIFVGALIARYFEGVAIVNLKWTLIGTLVVAILSYIPVFGPLVLILVTCVLVGTIVMQLYARLRT